MRSIIELMETIAGLPSLNANMRERARHIGWHVSHKERWPNGIYRGLSQ